MKGECPSCRAPCSLLGVNLILASIIESRFPDEYARRRRDLETLNHASNVNETLGESFSVVIQVAVDEYKSLIPDIQTDMKLSSATTELNQNGFRFLNESGSNKLCLSVGDLTEDRRFYAMADLMGVGLDVISVKVTSRCEMVRPLEVNINGGYLMGQFRPVKDEILDSVGEERVNHIFRDIHGEFQRQWRIVGMAGRDRLIHRLEALGSSFIGSAERAFLTSTSPIETFPNGEKLSFLLSRIVLSTSQTLEYIVSCTDTIRRLDLVLTNMKKPDFVVQLDEMPNTDRGGILRPTSTRSSLLVFFVILILLAMKGFGLLEFSHHNASRYRI